MKYLKRIIIFSLIGVLVVGYYFYVSHKNYGDASDIITEDSKVYKLITRNLDGQYYPEFPRNVVDFYAQITKAYYFYDLNEAEIEALGSQAKKLFDDELVELNPDETFFEDLKSDIEGFKTNKIVINDYSVEKSSDINMFTFDGREYATVEAVYYVSENSGKNRSYVYQDYTLRKDENGRWKILFWEAVPSSEKTD